MTSKTQSPSVIRYAALALQTRCDAVNSFDRDGARAAMLQSINRIGEQVRTARRFIGQQLRLVVLPEYFMTGFPMGESIEGWAEKACIQPDGIEMEKLSEVAQSAGVYLSGNLY